jgi:hypothetical protein
MEQMTRFYIVGAKDVGKRPLADDLLERFTGKLAHQDESFIHYGGYAVGTLADYRVEMRIASDRVTLPKYYSDDPKPVIYTHSLIDSLVYSTLRFERLNELESTQQYTLEKAVMVMTMIGTFIRDTFEYDHVFLILTDEPENEAWEEMAQTALDAFEIDHTILRGSEKLQWVDQTATIIEGYLNGQRDTVGEPALTQD